MRIAQVCPRYSPYIGGIETHVREVSVRLAAKGHDVTVITTDPSGRLKKEEVIDGVRVIRFKSFAPGDAYFISPSIRSFMKKESFDAVHAHSYHAFPALFAASSKAPRFVFTPHYHGKGHTPFRDLLHKPYKPLAKRTFKRADVVACDSEFEKSLVCRDFPEYCDKVKVVRLGVDKKEFAKVEPFPKGLKVILYVGRLEEYKGIQYIIDALPHLMYYRLVIVGKGPYKQALKDTATKAGVADRVAFLEDVPREEVLRWYRTADVFITLSQFEAFGIGVAEALTAGVPCIVANTSSLIEFIDGKSCKGLDIPVDGKTLADAIMAAKFDPSSVTGIRDWDEVADEQLAIYGGK